MLFFNSLASAQSAQEQLEGFKETLEVYESYLEQLNDSIEPIDSSKLSEMISDFRKAVNDFETALESNDVELQASALAGIYEVAPLIGDEIDRINESNKERQLKEFEKLYGDMEISFDVFQAGLDDAENKGKDISEAQIILNEVKELREKFKAELDREDLAGAVAVLNEIKQKSDELKKETDRLGVLQDDGKSEKERVEGTLKDFSYSIELIELILDDAKSQGIDASAAESFLNEIKEIFREMEQEYDKGNISESHKKLLKIFIVAVKLQDELRKINPSIDDSRTNKEKVEDSLREWKLNKVSIEHVLKEAKKKGKDVSAAENLFNSIKSGMEAVSSLADKEDFESAWKEIMKLFKLGVQFRNEFSKLLEKLNDPEEQRKEISKIISDFESNRLQIKTYLDALKSLGKDVRRAEELLKEIDDLMTEAKNLAEGSSPRDAWKALQKAFLKGGRLQKEFKKFELTKEKIESTLSKADNEIFKAQKTVDDFKAGGKDTEEMQELLNEIKKRVEESKKALDKDDLETASEELKQVFRLSKKLEKISEDLL